MTRDVFDDVYLLIANDRLLLRTIYHRDVLNKYRLSRCSRGIWIWKSFCRYFKQTPIDESVFRPRFYGENNNGE